MLDNVVRILDKMWVVYREMSCDGAKSNVEYNSRLNFERFFMVCDGMLVFGPVHCEKRSRKNTF